MLSEILLKCLLSTRWKELINNFHRFYFKCITSKEIQKQCDPSSHEKKKET